MSTAMGETPADPGAGAVSVPASSGSSATTTASRNVAASGAWLLRHRFALLVLVVVGLVFAGQLAEDAADTPPLQMLPPNVAIQRWTIVVVALYMIVIAGVVDRVVRRSLAAVQRAVRLDAKEFEDYAARMNRPGLSVETALLVLSALIVAFVFVVAQFDLPLGDGVTREPRFLPSDLTALVVLGGYTVIGWVGLSLVYSSIRLGRALGSLSHRPLEVDVFDTTNLLPLGNIALAVALAPAGIIVIFLVGLGRPNAVVGWTVLVLAAGAALLAFLLPLRGIHRQMGQAKDAALGRLNEQIRTAYDEAGDTAAFSNERLANLSNRVNTLTQLRKTVGEMTTWPFRDTLAFSRAVLIASAPLIYAALSELIRVLWINPLSGP